jgi:hypothetical protein
MLQQPRADAPLQQGDIIVDVPFLVLPKAFNVKAQAVQGQKRLDSQDLDSFEKTKRFASGKQLLAVDVPFVLQLGMVVTQSCDLDNKDQITLARVFPLAHLVQQAKDAIDHAEPLVLFDVIRQLTEGSEYNHLIYVGDPEQTGPQAADLLRVQSYQKEWKECFLRHRTMSLTDEALKYLQGRLSTFTGRFATVVGFWHTPEHRQLAAQAGGNPNAIPEAYDRLKAKTQKPSP